MPRQPSGGGARRDPRRASVVFSVESASGARSGEWWEDGGCEFLFEVSVVAGGVTGATTGAIQTQCLLGRGGIEPDHKRRGMQH